MIEWIINWSNNNPGPIAILVPLAIAVISIVVAIVDYFFKRIFSREHHDKSLIQKQESGDNSKNYQAGRDIGVHE